MTKKCAGMPAGGVPVEGGAWDRLLAELRAGELLALAGVFDEGDRFAKWAAAVRQLMTEATCVRPEDLGL